VTDKPELPRSIHQINSVSAAFPELEMYSQRNGSEKPCLKARLIRMAPPVVDAPFATPMLALVGTLVYWKYGWIIQAPLV